MYIIRTPLSLLSPVCFGFRQQAKIKGLEIWPVLFCQQYIGLTIGNTPHEFIDASIPHVLTESELNPWALFKTKDVCYLPLSSQSCGVLLSSDERN